MCSTCGCGEENLTRDKHAEEHVHSAHEHHGHSHTHETVSLEREILLANKLLAERNRGYFEARDILALNIISSPGAGKTSLLEKIIQSLVPRYPVYVIEGDQQTSLDAARIEEAGARALQVNTGKGCHLNAEMVNTAMKKLAPEVGSFLFIENVGNLICPAMFHLGEHKRIVIYSVTEGDDKPLKYPHAFESSDICIISKTDLLPYVNFDTEKAKKNALSVNHHLQLLNTSAKSGEGIADLVTFLEQIYKDFKSENYIFHHSEDFT